jgi:hypothetical protein
VASLSLIPLLDVNNNVAESFNSIVNTFVDRKRINFSLKCSFEGSCYGAVVSYNTKGLFVLRKLTKSPYGNVGIRQKGLRIIEIKFLEVGTAK